MTTHNTAEEPAIVAELNEWLREATVGDIFRLGRVQVRELLDSLKSSVRAVATPPASEPSERELELTAKYGLLGEETKRLRSERNDYFAKLVAAQKELAALKESVGRAVGRLLAAKRDADGRLYASNEDEANGSMEYINAALESLQPAAKPEAAKTRHPCKRCGGSLVEPGSVVVCRGCKGTGREHEAKKEEAQPREDGAEQTPERLTREEIAAGPPPYHVWAYAEGCGPQPCAGCGAPYDQKRAYERCPSLTHGEAPLEREDRLCGEISHDEAEAIAQAYIDHSFNNKPGKVRVNHSIPADPRRDTDLRLHAYIRQQRKRDLDHQEQAERDTPSLGERIKAAHGRFNQAYADDPESFISKRLWRELAALNDELLEAVRAKRSAKGK